MTAMGLYHFHLKAKKKKSTKIFFFVNFNFCQKMVLISLLKWLMVLKAFLQLAEKRCHDIQHNDTQLNDIRHNGSHVMPSVIHAACRAQSLYAECHYAECRYAACCGTKKPVSFSRQIFIQYWRNQMVVWKGQFTRQHDSCIWPCVFQIYQTALGLEPNVIKRTASVFYDLAGLSSLVYCVKVRPKPT